MTELNPDTLNSSRINAAPTLGGGGREGCVTTGIGSLFFSSFTSREKRCHFFLKSINQIAHVKVQTCIYKRRKWKHGGNAERGSRPRAGTDPTAAFVVHEKCLLLGNETLSVAKTAERRELSLQAAAGPGRIVPPAAPRDLGTRGFRGPGRQAARSRRRVVRAPRPQAGLAARGRKTPEGPQARGRGRRVRPGFPLAQEARSQTAAGAPPGRPPGRTAPPRVLRRLPASHRLQRDSHTSPSLCPRR